MSDEPKSPELEPILEIPVDSESPTSALGPLFGDESVAIAASKVSALEGFLGLVTRDIKFQDFMREILMIFLRNIKSEAGSIFELDTRNNVLFFRAVVGASSDRIAHFVIPMGQGIVGHVAESRQPLVVHDIEENRIHLKSIQNAVGFETRNLIAVPITIRGKVFGVVELLNRLGEDTYSQADVELMTYLCDMAAKSIEARLTIGWALRTAKRAGDQEAA